jgi:hypothetical protein
LILKIVPKAAYDLTICSESHLRPESHRIFPESNEGWTLEIDFSVTEKKVWLSVQSLELGSIFRETSKSFIFVIFLQQAKTFFNNRRINGTSGTNIFAFPKKLKS